MPAYESSVIYKLDAINLRFLNTTMVNLFVSVTIIVKLAFPFNLRVNLLKELVPRSFSLLYEIVLFPKNSLVCVCIYRSVYVCFIPVDSSTRI